MSKIVSFIDGFNLYHALDYFEAGVDHNRFRKYKWLNLRTLSSMFVFGKDTLEEVLYFTTLATWDIGKTARHRLYIRALENEGVDVSTKVIITAHIHSVDTVQTGRLPRVYERFTENLNAKRSTVIFVAAIFGAEKKSRPM